MFKEKLNDEFALVTGASSGIGLAYARALAQDGVNLFLVSNQDEALREVQQTLSSEYHVRVEIMCIDLSEASAPRQIWEYCRNNSIIVGLLVNNAGILLFGPVSSNDPGRIKTILGLHVHCVTEMCRLFGSDMAERRHGYILNMSSMSAWMALPGIAMYNATKAYIYNYSCALYYELKPYNVGVTAVCPGAVDTSLFGLDKKTRRTASLFGVMMKPEKLVKIALKKTFHRKKYTIPGVLNHIFVFFAKHIPDWLVFLLMRRVPAYKSFLP